MKTTLILALFVIFTAACSINTSSQLSQEGALAYVGESSCAKCHKKIANSFKTNQHTEAFANIQNDTRYRQLKKEGREGSCLKCHVTGYGKPGGFISAEKTPELAKVGCQACHGPGGDHVDASNDAKKRTIQRKPGCGKCHLIHAHEK